MTYTLPSLLQIPHVENGLRYTVSPDGERIIFSWNKSGSWELWEIRGLETRKLESSLAGAKFAPQFSPDGSKVAFALDLDGSESFHIALYDVEKDEWKDLTDRIAYAHQPNISWSPDGESLAVLSDMKGQFALYILPLDGSPPQLKKNVFHPCWDAVWSPDGQWIALEAEWDASNRSIFLVPTNRPRKGMKAKTIQLMVNGQVVNAQQPAWSPDSKRLAFSADAQRGEWFQIGVFDAEKQEIEWVTDASGDHAYPAFSRDGKSMGWIHATGALTSFELSNERGVREQYQIGSGLHSQPMILSGEAILIYEDVNHPSDLWRINLADGTKTQLTNSLADEMNFAQPEEIRVGDVPALLYRAENSKRAVVYIHGGPNWNLQFSWNPEISYMVAQGWTVIAPNYRGSTGYGKAWQNASRYDMGGVDAADCAACAKYLLNNGYEKVAVTGRSHGGFLTMCCLTFYPELFVGGSAIVPFLNWFKSHTDSREDLQHWNIENMGYPEDNEQLWHDRSPYFFLERVAAPVQMISGKYDPRCPASDAIDARDKLAKLGKEVELLLYDEGHSFLKMENILDAEMKRIEFLRRVLE